MRALVLFAILILVSIAAPASADSAARQRAGRAIFDRQARALADGNLDAFANLFVNDGRAAAMFPSSRAVAVGRRDIRAAAANWAGINRKVTAATVVGTPIAGTKPDEAIGPRAERLLVVTGDLDVTLRGRTKPIPLRMTSVLSANLDRANPALFMVVAVFVSESIEERTLRGEDVVNENSTHDRFLDLLRFPDVLAGHFDAAADDIVLGSAPGELGKGADATKLLGRWKDHKIVVLGKPHQIKEVDWTFVMGTVSLARGGTQKPVPLNVLLVGYPECGKTCVGTELTPHVVAVHFGHPR